LIQIKRVKTKKKAQRPIVRLWKLYNEPLSTDSITSSEASAEFSAESWSNARGLGQVRESFDTGLGAKFHFFYCCIVCDSADGLKSRRAGEQKWLTVPYDRKTCLALKSQSKRHISIKYVRQRLTLRPNKRPRLDQSTEKSRNASEKLFFFCISRGLFDILFYLRADCSA
jgi:hypothetical protein